MVVQPLEAARTVAAPDIASMSGVVFSWPGHDGFRLRVEDFTIGEGERLLLVGPSGSGKSTFLGLLTGILAPQEGAIKVLGTDLAALCGAARDRFRGAHFGIIFQMFNLLPYGSVLDNVLLPLSFSPERRRRATAKGSAEAEAARLLGLLGIEPKLMRKRAAASLSVGQQQRVAAARALIGSPPIIVADEPTSALDRNRQMAFLDLLFEVAAEAGSTLVMVSHDETLSPRFDRVEELEGIARIGRIEVTP